MSGSSHRKTTLAILLVLVPLLLFLGWSQASLNLSFIRPSSAQETILLLALSAFIVLAFVIFALILARILLKLYAERRAQVLGSRFKTRMVEVFLALSLVPVCFLAVFAYGLLNRTIDKWFGIPFDTVRRDASEIVAQLERETAQGALHDVRALAADPDIGKALERKDAVAAEYALRTQMTQLELVGALLYNPTGGLVAGVGLPLPSAPEAASRLAELAIGSVPQDQQPVPLRVGDSTLSLVSSPVLVGTRRVGMVVGVARLPLKTEQVAAEIQREAQRYDELSRSQKGFKRLALSMLGLLTLLILFVATWSALFLAKQVTVPIQALAEGTHQVSRGNLGYQVSARAGDELGVLIHSFNAMTRQLEENRRALEEASQDLQKANRALEERGNTMATILENVSVGVISLDPQGQITQANSTVARMLGVERVQGARTLTDLFAAEEAREIGRLLRRAARQGVVSRQMDLNLVTGRTPVAVTLSSIRGRHGAVGSVLVLEDLTELLRAQRAAAWQEAAQRIAHEIKNPLTPIQLSAERIERLLGRAEATRTVEELRAAIGESVRLIGREAETLHALVNEFSDFARFPVSQPVPAQLNEIVAGALEVFNGRLSGVAIHRDLAADLPQILADPSQMKRALVNLIDNAAEAVESSPVKEIWVRTALDAGRDLVVLVVADSGPGISAEAKEKLFLPLFSTKRRGTGLGLAIVSRIVTEHRGAIRVEENRPSGTKFVIELPLERVTAVNAPV